jgi:hypothetical protein
MGLPFDQAAIRHDRNVLNILPTGKKYEFSQRGRLVLFISSNPKVLSTPHYLRCCTDFLSEE